ncbi:uncharacterized protein LOC127005623 [Eriocheir sinensis]|uniref:uncharacterized protein LOC126993476 n=1 Tax=Eriocheir sinensis TaxID=95602 RepID=UPI0021C709BD|nr:uncharacterized protein LOC126993476 [Eriocheir sinensis]XP_050708576.1 uncharacterized protein LOC126993476 [Eriocheir sinensis]XP_050730559.1 uncharacterized protein LOC127005623 [Eriocheir sinensis]XP_050730560.1 uncharacterized protein LOC127005623 [Eriocheir sinensis]XP_050730561.1 uncharacterized protein LOC127005623 [Eriocheir sinensis]
MAVRLFSSREAYLYHTNIVTLPVFRRAGAGDAKNVLVAMTALVLPVGILLERFFDEIEKGRSLGEEQAGVYEAVAAKLVEFGLDGRACVLRFICELQQRRLARSTVAGQLLGVLFTPRVGGQEGGHYLAAKGLGGRKGVVCASHYSSCPHSAFLYFEALRNLTTTTTHSPGNPPL